MGLAHVGVLEVLDAAGFKPDVISGTSIGALIGCCYGGGLSVADMRRVAMDFSWRRVRRRKILPTSGVYSTAPMVEFLRDVLPATSFDDLERPVACVATDLRTSQMVVLGGSYISRLANADDDIVALEAEMIPAIRASCTVPVLFEPVEIGGRILVDGFLTNNVPAGITRMMGASVVVAVDLQQRRTMYENPSNIFEYAMQSQIIYRYWAVKNRQIWADVVIRPDLRDMGWDDTAKAADIMAAGREATAEKLPEIERAFEAALRGAPSEKGPVGVRLPRRVRT